MGSSSSQEQAETKQAKAAAVEELKLKIPKMSIEELKVYLAKNNVDPSRCADEAEMVKLALKTADTVPVKTLKRPPKAKVANGPDLCFCWKWLMPEKAPDWYVNKLGGKAGMSGGDCHQNPAPEGSLLGIGHIMLTVPDGPKAKIFYEQFLGFHKSAGGASSEVRLNAGPSQVWLRIADGQEADRWPGDIVVWVDNIQTTYDHFIDQTLVSDYGKGINGGEFSMKVLDPFLKTFFWMTEAPEGKKEAIQKIGCEASSMHANVLALSALEIKCKTSADCQLFGEFYKHFFGAAITVEQYQTFVHFSPGKELHQTLTFRGDPSAPPASNLATFCFYLDSTEALQLAYTKCKAAGIVETPDTWVEAEKRLEFSLKGMVDPNSGRMLLPMRNIVRARSHSDCLISGK